MNNTNSDNSNSKRESIYIPAEPKEAERFEVNGEVWPRRNLAHGKDCYWPMCFSPECDHAEGEWKFSAEDLVRLGGKPLKALTPPEGKYAWRGKDDQKLLPDETDLWTGSKWTRLYCAHDQGNIYASPLPQSTQDSIQQGERSFTQQEIVEESERVGSQGAGASIEQGRWDQKPPTSEGYYWQIYRPFDDGPWGKPCVVEVVYQDGYLLDTSWRDANDPLRITPRELDEYGYPMQLWWTIPVTGPAAPVEPGSETKQAAISEPQPVPTNKENPFIGCTKYCSDVCIANCEDIASSTNKETASEESPGEGYRWPTPEEMACMPAGMQWSLRECLGWFDIKNVGGSAGQTWGTDTETMFFRIPITPSEPVSSVVPVVVEAEVVGGMVVFEDVCPFNIGTVWVSSCDPRSLVGGGLSEAVSLPVLRKEGDENV